MLNDSEQRQQATDPKQSFIVQAPAGSGKTEILTQRYLRLLNTVNAPEEIVALTFTRKAANEMRERILRTMQQVANGAQAKSAHQETTYAYAKAALIQNERLDWNLLQQPSRLRVITIDSLCQSLAQAIPLQDKQVHYAQISDKPKAYYLDAAQNCLAFAINNKHYNESIKHLLEHLDNQQDNLLSLFVELLSKRDQWLPTIAQAKAQNKEQYEQALAFIEQHEVARFKKTIPPICANELRKLAQQVALIEANPNSPRDKLCHWSEFDQLNGQLLTSLSALILTSENKLRKAFDHHVGLKKGSCPDTLYSEIKTSSKNLLAELSLLPDFLDALLRVKRLPEPQYHIEQWHVLQALFTLLPVLAGHLTVVFAKHNEVDFTALSQQALLALGSPNHPTDLTPYFAHDVAHILVDEFQDTSIQQSQLLQQLVHNWRPNNGKTLFVVGDPMQSIYRFRAAEVGLFLRAKDQGIGDVRLIPLELRSNFRSTANIVNWVNAHFNYIFPKSDDIESGAVTFHASSYVKPASDNDAIYAFQAANREEEARELVACVVSELAYHPNDTIAILVRSRNQLTHIVRELRRKEIPFQGVDIDLLADLPHLRDVWSLTQALLMPANRLAWLEVLRSPWCGLSLNDLHAIANFSKSHSIYYALSELEKIANVSNDGRIRAQFLYRVLQTALMQRHQQTLVDWLRSTLEHLHLPQVLSAIEQDDLEQYWILLERFEEAGHIKDWSLFKNELNTLYSQSVTPSRLQIMTIHKSKGLEFDCVFLPGLSSKSSNKDTPLLRWLTVPTEHDGELWLVSPMKAAHQEHSSLYNYLGQLDDQKTAYEQQRLLYVAVTRAKQRLYLFDHSDKPSQGSFRSLLKQQEFETINSEIEITDTPVSLPKLYHLPSSYYEIPPNLSNYEKKRLATIPTDGTARLIGIVAHTLLQWICDHHPKSVADIPWGFALHLIKTTGLDDTVLELIKPQFVQLFNDPIGRWIIQSHEQEQNEYAVLTSEKDNVVTRIIDRTFYDKGVRWIIDFKTGKEDPETQVNHRKQVNHYAELLSSNTDEPLRCGLYYLANGTWITWEN
jgi:ATP-dependent helicase/nuclease subunit A